MRSIIQASLRCTPPIDILKRHLRSGSQLRLATHVLLSLQTFENVHTAQRESGSGAQPSTAAVASSAKNLHPCKSCRGAEAGIAAVRTVTTPLVVLYSS